MTEKHSSRLDSSTFEELFLRDRSLIDTRAPIEFARGSFPRAVNLPLMTDVEREQVGIRYKEQGEHAAVALGHELVSGHVKEDRIAAWIEQVKRNANAALFCFAVDCDLKRYRHGLLPRGITCQSLTGVIKRSALTY